MKRILMILMAATLAVGSVTALAETVKLRDGTTFKDAVLVRITPATFIVQTGDALYELTSDEISPSSLQDKDFRRSKAPVVAHHYDEVHLDGTVTMYYTLPLKNDGKKALTETRWGLAPWERDYAANRTYVDDRGVTLVPTYDPPVTQWGDHPGQRVQVNMPLSVPLAPGESMTITGRETTAWTHKTDEGIVYSSPGDYAEDRLIWRKVRLPLGAHIVRVTPPPSARFTHEGHEYVMWRRFYKQGEAYPLEVVFTLNDHGR